MIEGLPPPPEAEKFVGRKLPCVYFLVLEGKVVYIGSSSNVSARLTHHRRDKVFDEVYYVFCAGDEYGRQIVEAEYINRFKPYYNRGMPLGHAPAGLRRR